MQETQVQSLVQEDTPGKEMATHSSFLAWKSPGAEEPGMPQFMGLQGVRHDLATEQQRYANPNLPVYTPPLLSPGNIHLFSTSLFFLPVWLWTKFTSP